MYNKKSFPSAFVGVITNKTTYYFMYTELGLALLVGDNTNKGRGYS
jgi:hypothetical protein